MSSDGMLAAPPISNSDIRAGRHQPPGMIAPIRTLPSQAG
jgi:hypothetical protein